MLWKGESEGDGGLEEDGRGGEREGALELA
jgi:hypothetical protein